MCRTDLALEILALRQQVAVLKRKRSRPKLSRMDRLFWTALRSAWFRWAEVLLIVKPETVVSWHRAGFRLYWRWRSRGPAAGRATITAEIEELIRRMARENRSWGAPKIHGELLKLGFVLSERSVSRYLRAVRRRGDPGKRWLAFLRNHREAIVGAGFLHPADRELRRVVLLLRHRACMAQDSTLPRDRSPDLRLGSPTTARSFPGFDSIPIRNHGSGHKVRCRGSERAALHRTKAQAHKPRITLAEWSGRTMGRKLPAGVVGPCDSAEQTAPATTDSGLRSVISLPRVGGLHHPYGWQQAA